MSASMIEFNDGDILADAAGYLSRGSLIRRTPENPCAPWNPSRRSNRI